MIRKHALTPDEREFFSMVRNAVLANPFSDERTAIDRKIAGLFHDRSKDEVIDETIREVERRVADIDQSERRNITRFDERDRELMMTAHLFVVFHRHLEAIDTLIDRQIYSGKSSLPVPFAAEISAYLMERGFSLRDSRHYVALCYQLRRAFYFIERGLVGRSACMKKLREDLWNNVFTCDLNLYNEYLWPRMEDFSTLILGETGTGKGTAARAIGMSGYIPFEGDKGCFQESFTRTFLPLNLSQFSESLIESELFGHRKGALDRKSTRLNSSHRLTSRMPSSA
jgi:hypothetical protein